MFVQVQGRGVNGLPYMEVGVNRTRQDLTQFAIFN